MHFSKNDFSYKHKEKNEYSPTSPQRPAWGQKLESGGYDRGGVGV